MTTSLERSADPSPEEVGSSLRPRVLADLGSPEEGPTLLVIGGLHGNEPAGVLGAERVIARLRADGRRPRGRFLALTGNRTALAAGKRFIDEDLNRIWLPEYLERVRSGRDLDRAEDREVAELDATFRQALAEAHGIVHLLDIHTTSGPGPAFTVLHDTLTNRAFARALPLPIALGLEEELNGTLTDHFTELGAVALSVETGQHDDAHSVDRAAAAIWIAMWVAGLLPEGYDTEVEAARELLEVEGRGLPRAIEVRYRHAIPRGSHFHMYPGFGSFQTVTVGQPMATEEGRTLVSPMKGLGCGRASCPWLPARPGTHRWRGLSALRAGA
jgi:succinylglutamate desuccinylase